MYFRFFEPQNWRKRFFVHRRGLIQRFPCIIFHFGLRYKCVLDRSAAKRYDR